MIPKSYRDNNRPLVVGPGSFMRTPRAQEKYGRAELEWEEAHVNGIPTWVVKSSIDKEIDAPLLKIEYDIKQHDVWRITILGIRTVTRGEDPVERVKTIAESMLHSLNHRIHSLFKGQ